MLTPRRAAARVALFITIMGLSFLKIQFIKVSLHLLLFGHAMGNMVFILLGLLLFLIIGVKMFRGLLYRSSGLEQNNDIVFKQILITSLAFHEVEPDAMLLLWPLAL